MFEKEFIPFSLKNIPIPEHRQYIMDLAHATNSFIKRICWRTYHGKSKELLNTSKQDMLINDPPDNITAAHTRLDSTKKSYAKFYGLKTHRNPPQNHLLDNFENDLIKLIRNIKIKKKKKYMNKTLRMINNMAGKIKSEPDIIVPADKTMNTYKLKHSEYHKLITKELHSKYRITEIRDLNNINREAKRIFSLLNIDRNTEIYIPMNPRFTLKDHKSGFNQKPSIRLISPCASDIAVISKKILDRIIPIIKNKTKHQLWISSNEVIEWFNAVKDKSKFSFIQFDIDAYYPSISPQLLDKALIMAKRMTNLTNLEIEIIKLARRTIIEYDGKLWSRKDRLENFDITMGSSDSAQVTDLVGLFILQEIKKRVKMLEGGLYRDDALFISRSGVRQLETHRKDLHKLFKELDLKITIENNTKVVDFLDLTLNLNNGVFRPYHKPNQTLYYIDKKSNHPWSVKRAIVPCISDRISRLSLNKEIFLENKGYYDEALLRSGYSDGITYVRPNLEQNSHKNPNGVISYNVAFRRNKNKLKNMNKAKLINTENKEIIIPATSPSTSRDSSNGGVRIRNAVNSNKHKSTNTSNNVGGLDRNLNKIGKFKKKNRRKSTVWFNPPFSEHIKTNIPAEFYKIMEKNFPIDHELRSIINKNNVKLSYSTTRNLANIIISSNATKLNRKNVTNENNIQNTSTQNVHRDCTCLRENSCPLGGKCNVSEVVYECKVKHDDTTFKYIGSTGGDFKVRYRNHMSSFRKNNTDRQDSNPTSLAKHVNDLVRKNKNYTMEWSILYKAKKYRPNRMGKCNLCLTETYAIMTAKGDILNIKSEMMSSCLHKNAFKYFKFNPP